jgi:hypothetical protein
MVILTVLLVLHKNKTSQAEPHWEPWIGRLLLVLGPLGNYNHAENTNIKCQYKDATFVTCHGALNHAKMGSASQSFHAQCWCHEGEVALICAVSAGEEGVVCLRKKEKRGFFYGHCTCLVRASVERRERVCRLRRARRKKAEGEKGTGKTSSTHPQSKHIASTTLGIGLTVRLLVTRACARAAKLLGLLAAGVSHEERAVV